MTPDTTENRIAALEATVEGLTEELVETKERLRLLEAEIEPATQDTTRSEQFGATKPPATESSDEHTAEPTSDHERSSASRSRADDESAEDADDDIIVA